MRNRHKGGIEIDGIWIFLILMFIILPLGRQLIDKLPGGEKDAFTNDIIVEVSETDTEESLTEVIDVPIVAEGKLGTVSLTEDISTHIANLNQEIEFKVKKSVVRAVFESPGKRKIKTNVKNGYISNIFSEEGLWEITTYDRNGETRGWHKINVH